MRIFATQKHTTDAVASVAFTATDEKNPTRVTDFLYAIQSQVTKPIDKCTALASSFSDSVLRAIGTQCSNRATELVEAYTAERKQARRSQSTSTPHQKAIELKKSMAAYVANTNEESLTFISPKRNERGESNPKPDRNDICYGTTPTRNLSSEFQATTLTLSKNERVAVAARLENEAARHVFTSAELHEAEDILRREAETLQRDKFSVEKESEALDHTFRIACVLIVKHSSHEDLYPLYKSGTSKFDWDIPIGDQRLNLDRQTESYKTTAYGIVRDNTPVRVACSAYTAEIIKYTWLMSLYNNETNVTNAVRSFKSLLGMKLQTLLTGEDRTLMALAIDNNKVNKDPSALFDFLRHRLNVMSAHTQVTKQVSFITNETQRNPEEGIPTIHAMGAGPRGQSLQGTPGHEVYKEVREDTYDRNTSIRQHIRPASSRPQTPGRERERRTDHNTKSRPRSPESGWESDPYRSGEDRGRSRSKSPFPTRNRDRSRSMSREPPRQRDQEPATDVQRSSNAPTRPATRSTTNPTLIRIIDSYNSFERERGRSQPRERPYHNSERREKNTYRGKIPAGACDNMIRNGTTGCDRTNCAADHGKWRETKRNGEDAPQCESEKRGEPCSWIWSAEGCYKFHNVKTPTKNGKAAQAAERAL